MADVTHTRASVYRASCACAPRSLLVLLKRNRRPAVKTNVGKYVDRKGPALRRKIAAVLAAQGKRVAAKASKLYAERLMKDAGPRRDVLAELIAALDSGDLASDVTDQLEGAMQAAFRRAAALGMQQAGIEDRDVTDQVDEAAVDYAKTRGGELITDLAGTTDEDMRALLQRAVEDGMSPDELSDAVQDLGAFSESRADMIARTELAFAHVAGNKEGWSESGVVVGKRSLLGDLHNVEDICDEAADAGVVGLEESFVDGADDPPYHPNCVCDIEPVLGAPDEGEDAEKAIPISMLLVAARRGSVPGQRAPIALLLRKNIDAAAHSAATSDLNLLRKPTEAQARAGNYKKGHARIAGLDVTIENPAGSRRRPQWPPLTAHYGYVKGTLGADGDHVDIFVRPSTPADWDGTVYVVDQYDEAAQFDEHKCLLGFDSEAQAVRAYRGNYPDDWVVGPVTALSIEDFRAWLDSGATQSPLHEQELKTAG
jgi:hypothetical protein